MCKYNTLYLSNQPVSYLRKTPTPTAIVMQGCHMHISQPTHSSPQYASKLISQAGVSCACKVIVCPEKVTEMRHPSSKRIEYEAVAVGKEELFPTPPEPTAAGEFRLGFHSRRE